MLAPAAPRWPHLPAGRGHYESYYLRAVHPDRPLGAWIRYTVTVPPGGTAEGRLWCTLFDRTRPGPVAAQVAGGVPTTGEGAWIRLGDASFGERAISGSAGPFRWELRRRDGEPTLQHLSRAWMYDARLPRTKLLSLTPATSFDGELLMDGERVPVEGWRGMVGHNWGEEHAARWLWLHGLDFEGGGPRTWIDLAVARVRLGPVTTPWTANGALSLDGRRIPLGGPGRRVRVETSPTDCGVEFPVESGTLTVSGSAPASAFVAWDYADPGGGVRRVRNCSVADLAVRLTRRGAPVLQLSGPSRGVLESGGE
jgi:hypothetical protein